MDIKPIETRYDGHLFRSRIEARWAYFYNAMGIEYEYEKEGYDLCELGWYLPDFWLPVQQCWIEIKGQVPNSQEDAKAYALAKLTRTPVYIFFGPIPSFAVFISNCSAYIYHPDSGWDNCQRWCECGCGAKDIRFEGRADRLFHKEGCKNVDKLRDKNYADETADLIRAYHAASSARFDGVHYAN